jgi:2-phosphoglycerate kinase
MGIDTPLTEILAHFNAVRWIVNNCLHNVPVHGVPVFESRILDRVISACLLHDPHP